MRAEERIRAQSALPDKAQNAILVRDLEDRILFWNKGAKNIYHMAVLQAEVAAANVLAEIEGRKPLGRV